MKGVDGINPFGLDSLDNVSEKEKEKAKGGAGVRPDGELSPDSAIVDLKGMEQVMRYVSSAREGAMAPAALERLSDAVARGTYKVDLDSVAEEMVREAVLLGFPDEDLA